MTGLLWVGYFYARRKNGSDEISGGNQIGSDTFQNGSDIIRYPTVILSPDLVPNSIILLFHYTEEYVRMRVITKQRDDYKIIN